eukprot:COSAG05_NODE_1213_length_5492_cov_12.157983_4_plen_41_part_00
MNLLAQAHKLAVTAKHGISINRTVHGVLPTPLIVKWEGGG